MCSSSPWLDEQIQEKLIIRTTVSEIFCNISNYTYEEKWHTPVWNGLNIYIGPTSMGLSQWFLNFVSICTLIVGWCGRRITDFSYKDILFRSMFDIYIQRENYSHWSVWHWLLSLIGPWLFKYIFPLNLSYIWNSCPPNCSTNFSLTLLRLESVILEFGLASNQLRIWWTNSRTINYLHILNK